MTKDELSWIASEVELPTVEEGPGGRAECNQAALSLGGGAEGFTESLAAVVGVPPEDPALLRIIDRARGGERASGSVGQWKVLIAPSTTTMRALCVPNLLEATSAIHRRAAAADLAAGVSHEVGNALGAILGWAAIAQRKSSPDSSLERALGLIEASAKHAQATARHMLELAGGQPAAHVRAVELTGLLKELAALLQPAASQLGARIALHVEEGLTVRGNRAQLYSAISNLLKNAIEASPPGGIVELRAARKGARVRIGVSDQGSGVPADLRELIFDPYFTTKSTGSGLGLPLVQRSVEAMGGHLALSESYSSGAHFSFELETAELLEQPSEPSGQRAKSEPTISGIVTRGGGPRARVLVVDDDRAMRELLATTLEMSGLVVTTAGTAEEVLAHSQRFDLALVDLGLRHERGDRLIAELRRRGQVRKALLVSGAQPPPDMDPDGQPEAWIRKPFELEDLLVIVREQLGLALTRPNRVAG